MSSEFIEATGISDRAESDKEKQYSITELNQHMSVILNGEPGWENKTEGVWSRPL